MSRQGESYYRVDFCVRARLFLLPEMSKEEMTASGPSMCLIPEQLWQKLIGDVNKIQVSVKWLDSLSFNLWGSESTYLWSKLGICTLDNEVPYRIIIVKSYSMIPCARHVMHVRIFNPHPLQEAQGGRHWFYPCFTGKRRNTIMPEETQSCSSLSL